MNKYYLRLFIGYHYLLFISSHLLLLIQLILQMNTGKDQVWNCLCLDYKKKVFFIVVVSSSLLGRSAISIAEEDKRCFACPTIPDTDINSRCIVPCHYNQRCYLKASHANASRK